MTARGIASGCGGRDDSLRLIGLFSYYAERPSWLAGCIASYVEAGIDHLVAIDGAYALFPEGRARSSSAEVDTIVEVCNGHGIGLTLVRPSSVWIGNEVEKRTSLFRHAEAVAAPNRDWYLVIDADEIVTRALSDWKAALAATDLDCADVLLWEREDRDTDSRAQVDRHLSIDPVTRGPIRKLFRAIPGLHVTGNHYTYRTPDGRDLWSGRLQVPGLDLTELVHIEHRTAYRSLHRKQASHDYYARRERAGIERRPSPRAV